MRPTDKTPTERDLFEELSEGMAALADARKGKRTLHVIEVDTKDRTEEPDPGS